MRVCGGEAMLDGSSTKKFELRHCKRIYRLLSPIPACHHWRHWIKTRNDSSRICVDKRFGAKQSINCTIGNRNAGEICTSVENCIVRSLGSHENTLLGSLILTLCELNYSPAMQSNGVHRHHVLSMEVQLHFLPKFCPQWHIYFNASDGWILSQTSPFYSLIN